MPFAVEYATGLGRVMVLTGDVDEPTFAEWPTRGELLGKLIPEIRSEIEFDKADARRRFRSMFRDLVGQLRGTLDQFAGERPIPFSWVAGLLLIFIGLVGPIDYYVVNRYLGRPLLGWITFPLIVLGMSGLIVYLASRSKLQDPAIRQLSVVDIDAASNLGRGFTLAQCYSPTATLTDYSVETDPSLFNAKNQSSLIGWWGVPGSVFGGLASTSNERLLPGYAIELNPEGSTASSSIKQLPFPASSTRSISGWWQF